jgi:hypothetical protein
MASISNPSSRIKDQPLKFFDDFKLKIATKHPFLNQAIHFVFFFNSFLNPTIGSFS